MLAELFKVLSPGHCGGIRIESDGRSWVWEDLDLSHE